MRRLALIGGVLALLLLPASAQAANKPLVPSARYVYAETATSGVIGTTDASRKVTFTSFCRGQERSTPSFFVKRKKGKYGFKLASSVSLNGGPGFALQDASVSPSAGKIVARLNRLDYPTGCPRVSERKITLVLVVGHGSTLPNPHAPNDPPPGPVPGPGASSLSMSCPAAPPDAPWTAGRPYEVGGQLTPDPGGAPIVVSWTDGAGSHSTSVQTTAGGRYWKTTIFFTPGGSSTGPFTVSARFAGDATRAPSAAPDCGGTWAQIKA